MWSALCRTSSFAGSAWPSGCDAAVSAASRTNGGHCGAEIRAPNSGTSTTLFQSAKPSRHTNTSSVFKLARAACSCCVPIGPVRPFRVA
jgi:hypothetical protein